MQLRYNLSSGDKVLPICYCSSCHTQGVLTSSQIDLDPVYDPTISYPAHLNDPIDDGLSQSSKGRSTSTADTLLSRRPNFGIRKTGGSREEHPRTLFAG